jgi:hypothetical protein
MLGLAIGIGSLVSSAQDTAVPFKQIEKDAQLSANMMVPAAEAAMSSSNGGASASPSAAGSIFAPPSSVHPRILDSKFFLLNGLHLGMAFFDVGMTQHCIAVHQCQEGNPMMPSSLSGQLGVDFAFASYGTFASYKLKKHGSKLWWLSPVIGAGAHGAGVASGFAHR